jgi:hypothetical protein
VLLAVAGCRLLLWMSAMGESFETVDGVELVAVMSDERWESLDRDLCRDDND